MKQGQTLHTLTDFSFRFTAQLHLGHELRGLLLGITNVLTHHGTIESGTADMVLLIRAMSAAQAQSESRASRRRRGAAKCVRGGVMAKHNGCRMSSCDEYKLIINLEGSLTRLRCKMPRADYNPEITRKISHPGLKIASSTVAAGKV
ncbi:hypothetical protein QAD02_007993 [Eretmocerus hayati]|uniref:Uncharacterized protein n=1 Tax=Eretmocerus hayati TaxID=131215 RepID=A0ACC2N613_9HYME|nr:hypothetical protein QAD02_007993 [Eretmocerus hayati]